MGGRWTETGASLRRERGRVQEGPMGRGSGGASPLWVLVRECLVAGQVAVFKHAHPLVLEDRSGRRREERARQKRQRVVAAALRLFLERGYVATTIEAIAREAAVAPATVYQAFGTKQLAMPRQPRCSTAARTAPVKEVMRDPAAADPPVRQLLREDDDQRRYVTSRPWLTWSSARTR